MKRLATHIRVYDKTSKSIIYDIDNFFKNQFVTPSKILKGHDRQFSIDLYANKVSETGEFVYEGDIIRGIFTPAAAKTFYGQKPKAFAVYGKVIRNQFGFSLYNLKKGSTKNTWQYKNLSNINSIELVGNEYDNPELLN